MNVSGHVGRISYTDIAASCRVRTTRVIEEILTGDTKQRGTQLAKVTKYGVVRVTK